MENGNVVGSRKIDPKDFDLECNCTDAQLKAKDYRCEHMFNYKLYLSEFNPPMNHKEIREYTQNWRDYNQNQENEKEDFLIFLSDLCKNIEPMNYSFGRKPIPIRDLVFAGALKIFTNSTLRRFKSDLNACFFDNYVSTAPCFATIGHFFQREELTQLLTQMIEYTAGALKPIETIFAVDSTGFSTTQFNQYCNEKHDLKREHKWLKVHLVTGVNTNIVAAVKITHEHGADSPQFKELVTRTAYRFNVEEVVADKAYSSRENYQIVNELGGNAYIPFKVNSTGRTRGSPLWRKAYLKFELMQDEFMKHYNKRSNAESTNFMIKSRYGEKLRNKTETAQVNEILFKILCHNITIVLNETHLISNQSPK